MAGLNAHQAAATGLIVLTVFLLSRLPEIGLWSWIHSGRAWARERARRTQAAREARTSHPAASPAPMITPAEPQADEVVISPARGDPE